MIIDTHMHLYDKAFDGDIDKVIEQTLNLGVTKMIAVGCCHNTSQQALQLAKKYPFIYPSIGLHPSDVNKEEDSDLLWLEELISANKNVVAIGEIGLDYYWNKENSSLQKEYFKKQLALAKKHQLPVIIHCRDAISDCYQILKDAGVKGVMHCYSSSVEMAKEFIKIGFMIGIGGVVTFKNSREIKEVVREIDLQYLLSETDSPYLAPEPFRGKRNIPGYTKYVIDAISEIKGISKEEVVNQLQRNAHNLFGI